MSRPTSSPRTRPSGDKTRLFGVSLALLASLLLAGPPMPAGAADAEEAQPDSCIEVEVNGQRAPSYDCLSQKLQPAPARGGDRGQPGLASESVLERPENQLGLFNRAATGHRMGNTFGTSVYPQRPPEVQPSLPIGPRPAQ
ncbi:hypothetical protein [Azoarcus indigens]|uniref:Uncharacterized protein n=1 Tax=Azoarcus indigens TaxID=29545 RepID=A0A4R6EC68_9RHOO|nr:hypothetical protein [Azoarcus indigens]TDN55737.1 hypothetical protein C7389_10369 [Azoarcus indigens]